METNNKPIKFRDIEDFSKKHNTFVMLGLVLEDNDYPDAIKRMNKTFNEVGIFNLGEVIELRHIEDNVLGGKDRSDFLIVCSDDTVISEIQISKFPNIIECTEDFIINYQKDYLS